MLSRALKMLFKQSTIVVVSLMFAFTTISASSIAIDYSRAILSIGAVHVVAVMNDGSVLAIGSNEDWNGKVSNQLEVAGWIGVIGVSAGAYHTVGLLSDGSVLAAGLNNFGQTNVGTWKDIVQISAREYHTLGLRKDGKVLATGSNQYRQIEVSSWSDIVWISTGTYHTVGLKSNGTVIGTGSNSFGQIDVGEWTDITSLAAGGLFTVGLKSDGTLVGTGYNAKGQLNIENWTRMAAIAAGESHTVGLRADGTVLAVGDNTYGQLNVSSWENIAVIAAGKQQTIGIGYDGSVVATGSNEFGQLEVFLNKTSHVFIPKGIKTSSPGTVQDAVGNSPPPEKVTGMAQAMEIQMITKDGVPKAHLRMSPNGELLAYAVQQDGKWSIVAKSTFEKEVIHLISGSSVLDQTQPAWFPDSKNIMFVSDQNGKPELLYKNKDATSITALIINSFGDQAPDIDRTGKQVVFQKKSGGRDTIFTVEISGMGLTNTRLTGTNPRWHPKLEDMIVYSDKKGDFYQIYKARIGDSPASVTDNISGDCIMPCWSPDGEWICFISNMNEKRYHLYVIKADGTRLTQLTSGMAEAYYPEWAPDGSIYFVSDAGSTQPKAKYPWEWTYSDIFRCLPVLPNRNTSQLVTSKPYDGLKPIASSTNHIVALKSDGTVVAAGEYANGQLNVEEWTEVISLAVGAEHTIGLKRDGTVYGTGSNKYGQIDLSDWEGIINIDAGDYHTVGVKEDGTVLGTGLNSSGQIDVVNWTEIKSVAAGASHTVGLRLDGTVVAVGRNSFGQLDTANWHDIVAVAAGPYSTLGIKSDGTVMATGYDSKGSLDISNWKNIILLEASSSHTAGLRSDGTVVATGSNIDGQTKTELWKDIVSIATNADSTFGLGSDGRILATGGFLTEQSPILSWNNISVPRTAILNLLPVQLGANDYSIVDKAVVAVKSSAPIERAPSSFVPIFIQLKNAAGMNFNTTKNRIASSVKIGNQEYIHVTSLDGEYQKLVGEGSNPKWQPNGSAIASTRKIDENKSALQILEENGTSKLLSPLGANVFAASWSPDGGKICYISKENGVFRLIIVDVFGTVFFDLVINIDKVEECQWRDDGYIYVITQYDVNSAGVFGLSEDSILRIKVELQ